jgi:hypothetical protein
MKKFIVEREIPGLSKLSPEELKEISLKSCQVVEELNKPYHWLQSYCTGDKMYCVHIAPDEDTVREHARKGGFPADKVVEVVSIIDPTTGSN